MNYLWAALIGLVGGVASGLFGVGGGIVMVPSMVLLLQMNMKAAVGTSLAVIIPTAIVGTWKHHTNGNVQWQTALALAPTALIGGYLGSSWVARIPAEQLKRAFGAVLVVVGFRLLFWKA
jgi:uncharacterized membrane protein YfcA